MRALVYFLYPAVVDRQDPIRLLCEAIVAVSHDKSDSLFPISLRHDVEDLVTGSAVEIPSRLVCQNDRTRFDAIADLHKDVFYCPGKFSSGSLFAPSKNLQHCVNQPEQPTLPQHS